MSGIYAALSFDEGETWPALRLISDDGPDREVETTDRRTFVMGIRSAEPWGYLSIHQAANGMIHLISSKNHYVFNLAWLQQLPPAPATLPWRSGRRGVRAVGRDCVREITRRVDGRH